MGKRLINRLFLILFTAGRLLAPVSHAGADERRFTVGVVPQFDIRKLHAIWRPILDRVEARTGYSFRLRGSSSIPDFEREFSQGQFDFAYMNPYHLIVANQAAGYLPLVRDHGRMLSGVLVVHRDGEIRSPADLDGKDIAFPAPNALGASLMMRKELHDRFGIDFRAHYVKTHDSVYLNVLLGETMAGGGVDKTLNRQQPEYRNALRVLHRTQAVAPHPLAALPGVPQAVREAVRDAFLSLGESDEGRRLLAMIPIRKAGPADISDYQPLKDLSLERFYVDP